MNDANLPASSEPFVAFDFRYLPCGISILRVCDVGLYNVETCNGSFRIVQMPFEYTGISCTIVIELYDELK